VQYGGKITDDLDRRMFKTYTQVCIAYNTFCCYMSELLCYKYMYLSCVVQQCACMCTQVSAVSSTSMTFALCGGDTCILLLLLPCKLPRHTSHTDTIHLHHTTLRTLQQQVWLTPSTCADSFTYNPAQPIFRIPKDFRYTIPSSDQIGTFKDYVRTFPEIDTPEIFGLHPNADLTFRVKEVNAMFSTLDDTQPKGGGGGGGASREDVVYEKVLHSLTVLVAVTSAVCTGCCYCCPSK
jgi:hypothetical protein